MTPFQRVREFLRRHKRSYFLGTLALLATDLAGIYSIVIHTRVLADLERVTRAGTLPQGYASMGRYLVAMSALFLGAIVLQAAARYYWRVFFLMATHRIARALRVSLYDKLGRLPLSFFYRTPTGDIMSRGTNDLDATRMMLGQGILLSVDTAFYLLVIPPILFHTSPGLSLWIFAMLPILFAVVRFFQKRVEARWTEVQKQLSVLSAKVQESTSGARVVKAYGQEVAECRAFDRLLDDLFAKQVSLARVQSVFNPLLVFLARACLAAVLAFGGARVLRGEMAFAELVRFLFFLGQLVWPMMGLGHVIAVIQQGVVSLRRLNEILNEREETARPAGGGVRAAPSEGRIDVRGLTFFYPGSARAALSGVSLEIPPRRAVAIVGAVGAGKSTLASLVPRLFDPPRGTVFVDGRDVLEYALADLREAIGYVPQTPFLFSDTVRENIAFADPAGIPEPDVVWAARAAQFADEVERFPRRYEQMIGERGVNLSGGQRQRATIARALLGRPRILILDDCLASVDLETEHRILQALKPLLRQTTCLWITHRVLSTRWVDEIVVLAEGRVVERGTFGALARRDGPFARMVRRQTVEEGAHERVR